MADQTPASEGVAVQVFTETPSLVRCHEIAGRVALTFGDDLSGVRLMGDAATVHLLIVEADRQLTLIRDGGQP